MNKSDLELLASQTIEIANQLIKSDLQDDIVKIIERYNSSLAQFIQLLETFPKDQRNQFSSAIKLSALHKELEESLFAKKASLKELIINLNSGMSVKNKYFKRGIKRTGIDRQG
jgi:hypothetical protein